MNGLTKISSDNSRSPLTYNDEPTSHDDSILYSMAKYNVTNNFMAVKVVALSNQIGTNGCAKVSSGGSGGGGGGGGGGGVGGGGGGGGGGDGGRDGGGGGV